MIFSAKLTGQILFQVILLRILNRTQAGCYKQAVITGPFQAKKYPILHGFLLQFPLLLQIVLFATAGRRFGQLIRALYLTTGNEK